MYFDMYLAIFSATSLLGAVTYETENAPACWISVADIEKALSRHAVDDTSRSTEKQPSN